MKNYPLSSSKTASFDYNELTEVEQLEIIIQLLKKMAQSPFTSRTSRLFYADLMIDLAFRILDLSEESD